MLTYPRLSGMVQRLTAETAATGFSRQIVPYLVDEWLSDYAGSTETSDIVETSVSGFSYLFDVANERLISAWGISRGRHGGPRDRSRQAGHPQSQGPLYHRGHAIPHTLGGGMDINLLSQRGSVNIGQFRVLERQAVATPGALYFTHWVYGRNSSQRPQRVEQGLLCPGKSPDIRYHGN